MDRGRMTGRMMGRTDSGEASFLIPTSFNICNISSKLVSTNGANIGSDQDQTSLILFLGF
jgi:hypothetical protein